MTTSPDVRIVDRGTIWQFYLLSDEANEWVDTYCDIPEYMRVGTDSFAADWRPGRDIARGMMAAGLLVATD